MSPIHNSVHTYASVRKNLRASPTYPFLVGLPLSHANSDQVKGGFQSLFRYLGESIYMLA